MSFADGVGSAKTEKGVSAKQTIKHEYRIDFLSFRAKSRNPVATRLNKIAGSFDFAALR